MPLTRPVPAQSLFGRAHVHHDGGAFHKKHWWKLHDMTKRKNGAIDIPRAKRYLRKHRIPGYSDKKPDRLAYLCTRAQRGMIHYPKYPVAALHKFCTQRGIRKAKGIKKNQLVELLEGADEDAQFPRFMELPPELRALIYEFSFNMNPPGEVRTWVEMPFNLRPPPIASASKLTRAEALPLFYAGGTLSIVVSRTRTRYREHRDVTELFAVAPISVLESVKRVEIYMLEGESSEDAAGLWQIIIELPSASKPYQITQKHDDANLPATWMTTPLSKKLDQGFRVLLDGMVPQRQGERVKLKRSDIYPIRAVFQSLIKKK